jgi:hypothetical protein
LGGVFEDGRPNLEIKFLNFTNSYKEFGIKNYPAHVMSYPHVRPGVVYTNNEVLVIGGNQHSKSESIKLNAHADIYAVTSAPSYENVISESDSLCMCVRENNLS